MCIAFQAKDEVRLGIGHRASVGIGLRGHRAYLNFLRTAIAAAQVT